MRSICAAFKDNEEPEVCRQLGSAECAVGAWGWEFCQGKEHRDVHRTRCVESFMSFDCLCGPGYEDMPKADGSGVLCVDINECKRWAPCGDDGRTACHNNEGSYTCALTPLPLTRHEWAAVAELIALAVRSWLITPGTTHLELLAPQQQFDRQRCSQP